MPTEMNFCQDVLSAMELKIIECSLRAHLQGLPMETYLTAFSYGSVVIFNAQSDLLTQALLNMCREFTKSRVDDQYAEELMVRIRPDLAVRASEPTLASVSGVMQCSMSRLPDQPETVIRRAARLVLTCHATFVAWCTDAQLAQP